MTIMQARTILTYTKNLWDKIAIFLVFFSLVFQSCKFKNNGLGQELTPTGLGIGAYFTDTIGMTFSQVKLDTTFVKTPSHIMVGGFSDPNWGSINVESYFDLASSSASSAGSGTLDSAVLYIAVMKRIERQISGVTTSVMPANSKISTLALNLYEVNSGVPDMPWDLNTNLPSYNSNPISSSSFTPDYEWTTSYIRFVLNQDFANKLFEFSQSYSSTIKPDSVFNTLIKGVVLSAGSNASTLLTNYTISAPPSIKLYYRDANNNNQSCSFFIKTTSVNSKYRYSFLNKCNLSYSNSKLSSINTPYSDSISSKELDNMIYVSSAFRTGARIKINTPKNLKNFFQSNILINKAELELFPIENCDTLTGNPAPILALYEIDNNGTLKRFGDTTLVTVVNDQTNYTTGTSTQYAYYDFTTNSYKFTLTDYLHAALLDKKELHFLVSSIFVPYTMRVRLHDDTKSKLRVYYTVIK